MPRFLIRIDGTNVLLKDEDTGVAKRVGFFATRVVEAANENEAVSKVKQLVSGELTIHAIPQNPDRPVTMTVDAISQLGKDDDRVIKGGFTFYPDEDH